AELRDWIEQRVPSEWFVGGVEVRADREEILVVGELRAPGATECDEHGVDVVTAERVASFRESTRRDRMRIAEQAELVWNRKVSWAVRCGPVEAPFTTQAVPVMTRLRMPE